MITGMIAVQNDHDPVVWANALAHLTVRRLIDGAAFYQDKSTDSSVCLDRFAIMGADVDVDATTRPRPIIFSRDA